MSPIGQSSNLLIARGPFMLFTVLISVIITQIRNISVSTLAACGALILGFVLTIHDITKVLRTQLRNSVKETLDATVLDNLLRSIFDPETGWIACFVGVMMGNAFMYTLPMNSLQRVKLLQSTLGVEENEAQVILQSPGGIKELLPESFKNWLGLAMSLDLHCEERDDGTFSTEASSQEFETNHDNPRCCDEVANTEAAPSHETAQVDLINESAVLTPGFHDASTSTQDVRRDAQPSCGNSALPLSVLLSIIRQMVGDRIGNFAEAVPNSTLLAVGTSSIVGLVLHLRCSPRARRQVGFILEGLTTLSLSGLGLTAFAALFAKSCYMRRQILSTGSMLPLSHIFSFVDRRRLQCFIAFLVMYFIKRRRDERY